MRWVSPRSTSWSWKQDLGLALVLAGAVYGLQSLRVHVLSMPCAAAPETCVAPSVSWPDRLTIGVKGGDSDVYSDYTQYTVGFMAGLLPIAVGGWAASAEILTLAVASLTNAVFNETVRLIVQRPRPYVYADPRALGGQPTSYTSFYSGHTSFATVAAVHLAAALRRRGPQLRRWVVFTLLGLATVLVFLTALFRVLSGYHFMSDVLAGALAGVFFGWMVSGLRVRC